MPNLEEITRKTIELLKTSGEALTAEEIADKINVKKRRVYDVLAVLGATNLIQIKKKGRKQVAKWVGLEEAPKGLTVEGRGVRIKAEIIGKVVTYPNEVVIFFKGQKATVSPLS